MEQLASLLADEGVTMRTSGIAAFEVEGAWSDLDAATATLRASGRSDGDGLG